jgi:hypothetical protein
VAPPGVFFGIPLNTKKKHKTMNFPIKHGKIWQNSDNLWQNEYRQRE